VAPQAPGHGVQSSALYPHMSVRKNITFPLRAKMEKTEQGAASPMP
jgi:ABC-type sugar transport system ATPase subunit